MSVTATRQGGPPAAAEKPAKQRYLAVDGLRGVCALALLFTHVAMIAGVLGTKELGGTIASTSAVGGFFTGGLQIFAGVFFVLTGMFVYQGFAKSVINGTPRKREGTVIRRVLRLLPAYYVMYFVVLIALNLQQIDSVWDVFRPLALLHIYDWDGWSNGMEITWTVPDMAQFYLLLPLLAWATFKFASRGKTARARAYRMMLPVPLLFAAGIAWLLYSQMNGLGTRALFWYPMGLMPEVAIGMVIAIWLELQKASPNEAPKLLTFAGRHRVLFLGIALTCLLINCARPGSEIGMDDYYSLTALGIFYGLLAILSASLLLSMVAPGPESRVIRAVFTNRVILFIGKISYGVYLWQFAVMHFYLQKPNAYFNGEPMPLMLIRAGTGFWELQLVTLVGTIILSTISYYVLERPLMNWGERVIKRRAARKAAAALPRPREESVPV
ncbi:acyltransferase family protein [Amycolatopsis sp. NPDC049868]|uniref:acyltransferase family protein n=1 Tax=Amycolatopsis sp. NPDC049868 TaxID=3363934 RepID=UPI003787BA05